MNKEEFILLALKTYFIEANTIEICLDNYGLKYDALVDLEGKDGKEVYPPLFAHFIYLINFYEDNKNHPDFDSLARNKLEEMCNIRFTNYINCLKPIAKAIGLREKLFDIYQNEYINFEQGYLSESDARLCAYYGVIQAIRKREEEKKDA